MNFDKYLLDVVKKISGNVLIIGEISYKIEEAIEKNNNIINVDVLAEIKSKKGLNIKGPKQKKVKLKKLRKRFKKKRLDYVICNVNEIEKYIRFFVMDSIYMTKSKIYCYGVIDSYKIDDLLKKYNRYNVVINKNINENSFIIEIDTSKAKNNIFKDRLYRIKDFWANVIDILGDGLLN